MSLVVSDVSLCPHVLLDSLVLVHVLLLGTDVLGVLFAKVRTPVSARKFCVRKFSRA